MKNIQAIILIAVFTIIAFSAVLYSSCKKDACNGVTCQNQGTCSGGKCVCPTGYSGDHCEIKTIINTDNCNGVNCQNHGTCVNGICHCPAGFSGTHCEIDSCSYITCLNQGTCVSGVCHCLNGYTGVHCEIPPPNYYSSITYTNNTLAVVFFNYIGIAHYCGSGYTYLQPGQSETISCYASFSAPCTAYTMGQQDVLGVLIGKTITWNLADNFPATAGDTLYRSLDAPAGMVFIKLINNNPTESINNFQVTTNRVISYPITHNVIPNDGHAYNMGYYDCAAPFSVWAQNQSGTKTWNWHYQRNVPTVPNAVITLTAD
ncbi:MAG: hypothetical protein WCG87_09185 [Bacteroidota bacterium]